MTVGPSEILGTLHYISGYTGFDGSDPEEQEGNFLALKVVPGDTEGVTTVVELVGGTKGAVTLDGDMNVVLHIQDKSSETVKVTVTKGDQSFSNTYTLAGLTCEDAEAA